MTSGLVALVALAGCSLLTDKEDRSRESPQAVFNTLMTALEEQDFATAVACLDPKSVDELAAKGAWRGLEERDKIGEQWQKPAPDDGWGHRRGRERRLSEQEKEKASRREQRRKRRFEVLDRYGLTKEASDALRKSPSEDAARAAAAARLSDPARFLIEFLEASETHKPKWVTEKWGRPRLDEVAIDGDRASGKVIFRAVVKGHPRLRDLSWDLSFVRLNGGEWRIVGYSLLDFVGVPWHWAYDGK
jgi:hypothetical protein